MAQVYMFTEQLEKVVNSVSATQLTRKNFSSEDKENKVEKGGTVRKR